MNEFLDYKTLNEKRNYFRPLSDNIPWQVETENEFDKLYDYLIDISNRDKEQLYTGGVQNHFFRGVSNACYRMLTSAQLYAQKENTVWDNIEQFQDYICDMLSNISANKYIKAYYKSLNVTTNDLLYLAFLQHYGAKTPMLDFTHNIDIALYFSIKDNIKQSDHNDIDNYNSLYLLDLDDYGSLITNLSASWANNCNTDTDFQSIKLGMLDLYRSDGNPHLKWSNIRVIAQQGALLYYNEHNLPLEVYFKNNRMALIRCVNINRNLNDYIRTKINKSQTDVFPNEETISKEVSDRAFNHIKISQQNS